MTPTDYFNSGGDESPLATEPRQTSIEYGLQNYLMNDPAYMQLYGIVGGNEQLPQSLASRIEARFLMNHRVLRIGAGNSGQIRIEFTGTTGQDQSDFDFVIIALPHNAVEKVEFVGDRLGDAVRKHQAHYHHPAHYLRITILFDRPFWQGHLIDSYCMLDQLGDYLFDSTLNGVLDSAEYVAHWIAALVSE